MRVRKDFLEDLSNQFSPVMSKEFSERRQTEQMSQFHDVVQQRNDAFGRRKGRRREMINEGKGNQLPSIDWL
jgi:hypothetical protein